MPIISIFVLMETRVPFWPAFIATGFGSGFSPVAPGTVGALVATVAWLSASAVMAPAFLAMVTGFLAMVATIVGTWATGRVQPYWGADPSRVVIDEMAGMWLALTACPHGSLGFAAGAFVLFRLFDIFKPMGIRVLDSRHGAFWVMADDLLAGAYALAVVLLTRLMMA